MSLRSRVFDFLDNDNISGPKPLYKKFPNDPKTTVRRYFYDYKKINASDITSDLELKNLDTIMWMEKTIQRIKDPVRLAENISRLHSMKLKPLVNKEQISLKEMLDAS